jgi:stalled ribosome alternative rescue factor ArfA
MERAEKKEKGKGKTHHHNKKENQQKPKTFSFLMEIFEALFIFSISGAF